MIELNTRGSMKMDFSLLIYILMLACSALCALLAECGLQSVTISHVLGRSLPVLLVAHKASTTDCV